MMQIPLDHAHGESKDRLKHFARIERELRATEAGKDIGRHRSYDDKSRRLAEYLAIDRRKNG